ncbi:MAG: hypothetical protein LBL74_03695 [Bacteroidales bacterium]|jgi:hypothetical protein|nr:hypothetical protein [Bacteroidales bacterium]
MGTSILVIFAVIALIISRFAKVATSDSSEKKNEKKWQNEGKSILEMLLDREKLEKNEEKQKINLDEQCAEVNMWDKEERNRLSAQQNQEIKQQNQGTEQQNKENKFSLKEAVIYNAILDRPYK